MRYLFLTLFTLIFLTTQARAGLEEGKRAYENQDWLRAIIELRPLVAESNVDAIMMLANMYSDGNGVQQNHKTAFDLYSRAADLERSDAMLAIGVLYMVGVGAPKKDFEVAVEWFETCANTNYQLCQFYMGIFAMVGRAVEYMTIAPLPGQPVNPKVAELLSQANPVGQKIPEAYIWFRLAAENGNNVRLSKATSELAKVLAESKMTPEEVTENEKKILDWLATHPSAVKTDFEFGGQSLLPHINKSKTTP